MTTPETEMGDSLMFGAGSELVRVDVVPEAVVEAADAASAERERSMQETAQSRSMFVAGLRSECADWKRSSDG